VVGRSGWSGDMGSSSLGSSWMLGMRFCAWAAADDELVDLGSLRLQSLPNALRHLGCGSGRAVDVDATADFSSSLS